MNEMAWSYRAIGAKVWMLDLGRSFEKLCRKAKGTYIEFRPDVDICLDPFTHIVDINEDIDMLVPASPRCARCSTPWKRSSTRPSRPWSSSSGANTAMSCASPACATPSRAGASRNWAWSATSASRTSPSCSTPIRGRAVRALLRGRNNIDFSNDFIVIENEELKRRPDLHAVVNILLLHRITGEMYLTRNRRKVLFVDELKQQLGDIGADDPVKAAVIEEAARRARKYGGASAPRPRVPTTSTARPRWKRPSTVRTGFSCSVRNRSPSKCSTARAG
jgi:conjugal transfer ATP-binding protein TraC